jgi:hypothetical protein
MSATDRRVDHRDAPGRSQRLMTRIFFERSTTHGLCRSPVDRHVVLVDAGMELKVVGNQIILTGPVLGDEPGKIRKALADSPRIETIILGNSPGGNAPAGYQVGQLLRERRLRTAVSGYCYSSCSRMFLGGSSLTSPTIIRQNPTMSGFTGIMIGRAVWTWREFPNTVCMIGSSSTVTAKRTPRWWSAGSIFRTTAA